MGTYDIEEHVTRNRPARNNDRSVYSTLRLTVTRNRSGFGTVSVIVTDVLRGRMKDTRLSVGTITLCDPEGFSRPHEEDLRRALELVESKPIEL